MRINEIKDKQLRELAEQRTIEEKGGEYFLKRRIEKNDYISGCFHFKETPEGRDFWLGVSTGKITKLNNDTNEQIEEGVFMDWVAVIVAGIIGGVVGTIIMRFLF